MEHRQAIEYLPVAGTGTLEPATQSALAAHVERCKACRDWLHTRNLLDDVLSADGWLGNDHPGSALLAICVTRPEEIHEPDRETLRNHLQRCVPCRDEMELTRAAVREARPPASGTSQRTIMALFSTLQTLPHPRRALAAMLTVVFLAAGLFAGMLLLDHSAPTETHHQKARRDMPQSVQGQDLIGTQVISRERKLLVSKLTVQSGADVTFQAGDLVAFGDGFRVAQGARIRVGSSRSKLSMPTQHNQRNINKEEP